MLAFVPSTWVFSLCVSKLCNLFTRIVSFSIFKEERQRRTRQMTKHPFYAFVPSNWFRILQMQHCFGGFKLNQVSSYYGMAGTGMGYSERVATVADQGAVKKKDDAEVIQHM